MLAAFLAFRAFKVQQEILALLAVQAIVEIMALQDSLEIQDHREILVSKDSAVNLVPRVFLDLLVRLARRGQKVLLEILEHKV